MEEVERFAMATDPVLACCLCSRLIEEAVQLKCLHSCCRRCFDNAASSGSRKDVECGSCGTITRAGAERPNGFINRQAQRYRSIAESRVCSPCKTNGEPDKPAAVWCLSCRHSLCGDCIVAHRRLMKLHVTQSLDELKSLDDVCAQSPVSVCAIHKESVSVACITCEQAGCGRCCAECVEKKHELCSVSKESFETYIGKLVASISAKESEMLQRLERVEKEKSIVQDTIAARDRHLKDIQERKRIVVDAVTKVYEEVELSTKNMYDRLQAESEAATATADRLVSSVSEAKEYIRRLMLSNDKCEILNQQRIVGERLQNLSYEVDAFCDKLALTSKAVKIDASLPTDLVNIFRPWIGVPALYSASASSASQQLQLQQQLHPPVAQQQQQQQQSLSFSAASVSSSLPVSCWDVALTKDGRRLLAAAAWQHGLIELCCSSGRELSRWMPPKLSSSWVQDYVLAVAALSDGRAAVSLYGARCVVLLRRSDKTGSDGAAAAAGGAAWTEDRRFDPLPLLPGYSYLSAHGDLLAVAECSGTGRLQLLSLSSGQQLRQRQREYRIRSVAVAARVLVTLSEGKVKLGGGRRAAQVLDAHSLADGDERLWRLELEQEEELQGICADSTGGCLYAAVQRRDRSSGRVCALSLADGSELQRVALSFSSAAAAGAPQLLPVQLSLSDDGAAAEQQEESSSRRSRELLLAVLCWDSASKERKTVTVHRSSS